MKTIPIQPISETLRAVFKLLHYPIEIMLPCVRWYVAYPLSLRHIEEMMAERGVIVDHATIHRWAINNPAPRARGIRTTSTAVFLPSFDPDS